MILATGPVVWFWSCGQCCIWFRTFLQYWG